ncbi:UdgX family uracil-DNA binding protein [Rhodopirellula sp. JC740]|uniref:Type-4 uracil-DNA glycosylase n=1 Tax=Rhodopirellula halodulae TaxID=2894198 RepID=A0ABS8NNE9_9BACT|nr:UdgX family uracil-DNA binding protein [Rhodopirellula sp. JC740]MCC9645077.1 UdgX family uracil-DNA binding protein [Rhodopirellula sp. JC740]
MTASEECLSVRATRWEDWRNSARRLLISGAAPETIHWIDGRSKMGQRQSNLFAEESFDSGLDETQAASPAKQGVEPSASPFRVPKPYLNLARSVAHHRSPKRWELLYRLLWRITGGEKHLLTNAADADVHAVTQMEKSVRRDAHKMKAFVRFREIHDEGGPRFVAWHRPDHYTLELVADFFARRFDVMRWAILTPDESAFWDGKSLTFGTGAPRSDAPADDELEEVWKTYYANIFNPARIKLSAMRAEMPRKHWATMPETELIDDLVRNAPTRVETMIRHAEGGVSAKPYLPELSGSSTDAKLKQLRRAASVCEGCDLHGPATQTVFGVGNPNAKLVLVGEQPGDQEDLLGSPFIGPAGQLLDEVLQSVGLDREELYITNAVKHFKFKPTGKRRLHVKPAAREVAACRPWLESELDVIRPSMIVALGATAAKVLLGPAFRLLVERGQVHRSDHAKWTMATYHPSAILRVPNEETRQTMREAFAKDLQFAAEHYRMLP